MSASKRWAWRDRSPGRWVHEGGKWMHRPPVKVLVNTILRAIQPGRRKLLLASMCVDHNPGMERPRALGYEFAFIEFEAPP